MDVCDSEQSWGSEVRCLCATHSRSGFSRAPTGSRGAEGSGNAVSAVLTAGADGARGSLASETEGGVKHNASRMLVLTTDIVFIIITTDVLFIIINRKVREGQCHVPLCDLELTFAPLGPAGPAAPWSPGEPCREGGGG